MSQLNYATAGNSPNSQKYPIICKDELGPAPKNVPVEKVDVNSDGLIDLIATYPWGGGALYLNCGNGQYYRVIRSNEKLLVDSVQNNDWLQLGLYGKSGCWFDDRTTIIDNKIYRLEYLHFDYKDTQTGIALKEGERPIIVINYGGLGYKIDVDYCKGLDIYAPRYRFEYKKSDGKNHFLEVTNIYMEVANKKYQVDVPDDNNDYMPFLRYDSIYFTDLDQNGYRDIVLEYSDTAGSGAQSYAGLFLNNGDDSFVFAGEVVAGLACTGIPVLKSQKVKINGNTVLAIVYKEPIYDDPFYRDYSRPRKLRDSYKLYLFNSKLKEFFPITALPGSDKSTFVSLDKKRFENFLNPPVLQRGLGTTFWMVEDVISTLVENYEKALVDAINSNNFSLVAEYLTPGSNLYKSQEALVSNLYQKKTQEKLVAFKVEAVKTNGQANVYQVYVTERIGIKRADKTNFTVSEFRWVYTVVFDGGKYSLSEIAKRDGK